MKKKLFWPAVFIGPYFLLFTIFFLFPAFFGLYVSLTEWDMYNTPEFVGLQNYAKILFDESSIYYDQFRLGMGNTLLFVVMAVPLCVVVPLLLAVLLNSKPKGHKFFQSILYMPTLFSISAVMIIWSFLLSLSYGPFRTWFGMDFDLKSTQPWAWICIVGVTLWWCMGSNLVIYVAALAGIPVDQLEAATIDGAGSITKFFKVVIPNLRFQLLFTTVTTTVAQFNIYGQPLMLTGGGPNNSTRVMMMYIQENAFGKGISTAGMSSAMATLMGLVIIAVSAVQLVINRRNAR
ncbi:MAG: sugar ABC transporter permease [Pseudobutyrivibrio sp.]|nr:sugar ABC transporter permease [Pseudobutyrivibrio sp.]